MKPVSNETLVQQLQWRYATKAFDTASKIPDADWQTLEQVLILTPSSYGLQPWRFVVVTDQAVKEKLVSVSWNQKQPGECSHMVVMAIRSNFCEPDIDNYIKRMAEVHATTVESFAKVKKMMVGGLVSPPPKFDINEWAVRQVYIALGNFMTAAAMLGIDTCPMEGIMAEKYDEILGLSSQGYATAVACAAGYRASHDKYATMPKVRFLADSVIQRI
jgi:nitroreductase